MGKKASAAEIRAAKRQSLVADSGGRKLAEVIAESIEDDIVAAGWPVGKVLGSEPDLLARFGVGREVFRAAMRILEHRGVAVMRRGVNGGLVVSEPDTSSLARTVALLLDFNKVTGAELADARLVIETAAAAMAARFVDEDLISALKAEIAREADALDRGAADELMEHEAHGLHILLANGARNHPLELFVEVLIKLTTSEHGRARLNSQVRTKAGRLALATTIHEAHRGIVEAVVSGDSALAQHRMRRHLEAMSPWLT